MLTQERLKELLHYDPETGVFTRIKKILGGNLDGSVGVSLTGRDYRKGEGYLRICIDYKSYRCHRLAWLYMTGEFPKNQLDHIDLNKKNNKWENLREATNSQNHMNMAKTYKNTSGFKGVSWCKKAKKFRAHIKHNKKFIHIGLFDNAEAANDAVMERRKVLHGEYANYG